MDMWIYSLLFLCLLLILRSYSPCARDAFGGRPIGGHMLSIVEGTHTSLDGMALMVRDTSCQGKSPFRCQRVLEER